MTEENVPQEFLCPITGEIMRHPVVTVHGHSFEREAIFEWLKNHSTCPLSRRDLKLSKVVSHFALQHKICAWCEANDMLHLLDESPRANDDDDDDMDPRHKMVGMHLTKKQEREMRYYQERRENRNRRRLARLVRRGGVSVRVVVNALA